MNTTIQERIQEWCRQENIFREEVKEATSVFHFRVAAPGKATATPESLDLSTVDIRQATGDNDKIIVTAGIAFDADLMAPMKTLPTAEETIFELNMTLESRLESYYIDYEEGLLKEVVIIEEIFFDGLTKDRLFRALRSVNKGLISALWVLRPLLETLGTDIESQIFPEAPSAGPVEEETEAETKPTGRFCPDCGKETGTGQKFCTNCGKNLTGV